MMKRHRRFLRPGTRRVRHMLMLTGLLAAGIASAQPELTEGPRPYGALFRALAGDELETRHGIGVLGFSHVTLAYADNDIAPALLPQGRGRNLQPQGGLVQDEGLNLNQVGLIVCKAQGCPPGRLFTPNRNVLSRVGPLPGAVGKAVIVDWAVSAVFGEDAVFWKTRGLDDWRWDADDRERLAITQWFLDVYLPWGAGASVILGSFHSPLAHEIGYPFIPPNWFSSRTYAFAAGPAKHVGALAQAKLPLAPQLGHASAGFGIVTDWNSLDLGSGDRHPTLLFEARWRSPDMATWIDLEASYGNGEDDFGDVTQVAGVARPRGGGSQYLALSSRDEMLARAFVYLSVTHAASERTALALETVYGYQEGGDLAPLPFAIVRDAEMFGANLGIRHRILAHLHAALRVEWFRDAEAANVGWAGVGAGGGDVRALTVNIAWEPRPHLLLRPEIKYDVYDGRGSLFAPDRTGVARRDAQLLGVLNLEFRF